MIAMEPLAEFSPSHGLLDALRGPLVRHAPFSGMAGAEVDFFLAHCEERYHGPGEVVLKPADGPLRELYFVREGAVTGRNGLADVAGGAFAYEPGELFPLDAAVAHRAVTATYTSNADTFLLALPLAAAEQLAARSPAFSAFLTRRVSHLLELSRVALQGEYASQALAQQSLETALGDLPLRAPVTCDAQAPLREALQRMHGLRIGSIVVTDAQERVTGILTRHDVLGRVVLAQVPLDTPVGQVMVRPVRTLTVADTAQDAALLMSAHGIRHVPVTRDGVLAGLVSERDLFALQRLSLKQVGKTLRAASDLGALRAGAADIRHFARSLLGQGVHARQLTALVSHLNDVLTRRLLEVEAARTGFPLRSVCWLALGSEGRQEQTVATDQDNALILPDEGGPSREAALAFGQAVNQALAACGYPLCKGGIMAGEPQCCLTLDEWRGRFAHWIAHGSPHDLLQASIFFDLRPLCGDVELAHQLQAQVLESARQTPRFLKQMAQNALSHQPPLDWMGHVATGDDGCIDLKLQGTAIIADGARVYALAQGAAAAGTRARIEAAAPLVGVPEHEWGGWVAAFEFLQTLRLRVQLEARAPAATPNRLRVEDLNDIDRRMLKEALRAARQVQQRLHLDYER